MFSLFLYAFALLFQERLKILKFNKSCFFELPFQTCIQRYLSEKYQQPSEIETSVNVSAGRTVKNCQLEIGRLFNTTYFVAKEGLSFRKYPKLCSVQSKNDLVLGKNYLDVACSRLIFSISESLKDKRILQLVGNKAKERISRRTQHVFFSVLLDGSTDSGVTEQEAIYVRYLENSCPQTKFAGIKPPIKGDAEELMFVIEDVLKSWRAQGSIHF